MAVAYHELVAKQRSEEHRNAISQAVANSRSAAGALKFLGRRVAGGNYKTLYAHIAHYRLDTLHWTRQGHLRGGTHNWARSMALNDVLVELSPYCGGSYKLKRRLVELNLLPNCCQRCGIVQWLDQPLQLHQDHINGASTDNRLQNLRLLCLNCHCQTETYCGKNKRRKYKCATQ